MLKKKTQANERHIAFLAAAIVSPLRETSYSVSGIVGGHEYPLIHKDRKIPMPIDRITFYEEEEKRELARIDPQKINYFVERLFVERIFGLCPEEKEILKLLHISRCEGGDYSYREVAKIMRYKRNGVRRVRVEEAIALKKLCPYVALFVEQHR